MNKIKYGAVAGITATIVLSIMMLIKGKMGVMPELDIIAMLAGKMGASLMIGWVMHFMIGIVYGVGFSMINQALPTTNMIFKGVSLGVIGWLVMMVMMMPMMDAGFFGIKMGVMAPMMTLVLHAIFGAVIGLVYKTLHQKV